MATVYETLERPLVPVLAAMERAGIKVDRERLHRLSNDFATRIAELETEIHGLAGRPFTIGSPKQLGEILFDEMGLDGGGRKGKSGAYSTGADVLEALAAQGHDLPARVLEWRQASKLKSTYTDALQDQINPETGRVHTSFSQAVASTGRLSSNDPNLQNIPVRTEEGRKIREAFVAEPGTSCSRSTTARSSCRLAAHIADGRALQRGLPPGPGHPRHDRRAGLRACRSRAWTRWSGAGPRRSTSASSTASRPSAWPHNLGIPQGEAKAYIEAYFERYPAIKAYMEETKARAARQGFVTTLFGRRIHLPGIKDKNPARRSFSRARRDQRADPGHGRRHHQARHDPRFPRPWPPRTRRPDAAPGPRRTALRSARGRGRGDHRRGARR